MFVRVFMRVYTCVRRNARTPLNARLTLGSDLTALLLLLSLFIFSLHRQHAVVFVFACHNGERRCCDLV